jgi:hypothetical protein
MTAPSIEELYQIVLQSNMTSADKKEMFNEIRKLGSATRDRWIFRYVVWILGGAVLIAMAMAFYQVTIPDGVLSLVSAAVGALAAFLSPGVANQSNTANVPAAPAVPPNPVAPPNPAVPPDPVVP